MSNHIVKDWKSQTDREREARFLRRMKSSAIMVAAALGALILIAVLSELLGSSPKVNQNTLYAFENLLNLACYIAGGIGLIRLFGTLREPIDRADAAAVAYEDQMEMNRSWKKRNKKRSKK